MKAHYEDELSKLCKLSDEELAALKHNYETELKETLDDTVASLK